MSKSLTRLALSAALALALAACGGSKGAQSQAKAEKKPAADPIPVEVATVATGALAPVYPTTATLEAEREAKLLAEQAGEVEAVLVEEGDFVKAGQVLARVDSNRARLERDREASEAKRMEHDADRGATLLSRGLLSQQAAEQTRYARDTQSASLALAQLKLDKTAIRAPYAGVVTRRYVKPGQFLATGAPAFDIADFSQLKAKFNVPERASSTIAKGQPVKIAADALSGVEFKGTVERIAPVVDRASGTVMVTVAVDPAVAALRPGLFVRMDVQTANIGDAVLLPKSALLRGEGGSRVYVVEDAHARARHLKLGLEQGEQIQVLSGLTSGTQVVTVGQEKLADGDAVEVLNGAGANAVAANTGG
jgi:membrane fusion protein (multidrug efflux system)